MSNKLEFGRGNNATRAEKPSTGTKMSENSSAGSGTNDGFEKFNEIAKRLDTS